MALTLQQKAFCDYLLTDPEQCGYKCYRKAYPSCKTDKTAEANASRMLKIPHVAEYLESERAKRSDRTKIDADWLLRRLAEEVEADIAELYDEVTGALKPVHKWPKIFRMGLVAGIDVNQITVDGKSVGEVVKVKLADRNAKLKMIGDHIGVQAFKQLVDHGVQKDNPIMDLIKAVSGKTLDPK